MGGKYVTSNKCNLSCTWCHDDYFSNSKFTAIGNLDFYNIIRRILDITCSEEAYIRFAGSGDPTVAGVDELQDLITRMNSIPEVSRISMTTNGILLGSMIEKLKMAGLSDVTISLNSLRKDGYYEYAGKNCLDKVLKSINSVLVTGLPLKINMIYSKLNHDEIGKFEQLSGRNGGIPIKVIDLLCTNGTKGIYLPLEHLYSHIESKIVEKYEKEWPYKTTAYRLRSGAVFVFKSSHSENDCPNTSCVVRDKCLEGCRHSIRVGLDGVLKPCGIRNDNTVQLLRPNTSDQAIVKALQSGGKYGF